MDACLGKGRAEKSDPIKLTDNLLPPNTVMFHKLVVEKRSGEHLKALADILKQKYYSFSLREPVLLPSFSLYQ